MLYSFWLAAVLPTKGCVRVTGGGNNGVADDSRVAAAAFYNICLCSLQTNDSLLLATNHVLERRQGRRRMGEKYE